MQQNGLNGLRTNPDNGRSVQPITTIEIVPNFERICWPRGEEIGRVHKWYGILFSEWARGSAVYELIWKLSNWRLNPFSLPWHRPLSWERAGRRNVFQVVIYIPPPDISEERVDSLEFFPLKFRYAPSTTLPTQDSD